MILDMGLFLHMIVEYGLGFVDMCIRSLGEGLFLHVWKMLHVERLVWVL